MQEVFSRPKPHLWLCQSAFSFLQGCSHPRELILAALENDFNGICLSDFDGVYGLANAYLFTRSEAFARAQKDRTPLNLFYGTQVRVSLGHITNQSQPYLCDVESLLAPAFLQSRLVLIAESKHGYEAINRLLCYTHREGKNALPLDLSDPNIPWPTSDVTAILPMRGMSSLCTAEGLFSFWLKDLKALHSLWQQNSVSGTHSLPSFYLAITPPSQPLEYQSLAAHLHAHEHLGIDLIATEDVFFANPNDKEKHDLIQAIRLNASIESLQDWACLPNRARSMKPSCHLLQFCESRFHGPDRRFLDAYTNNLALAKRINFSFAELHYQYPREFVPQGLTSFSFLSQLTWQRAHERYPMGIPEKVHHLLTKELQLIHELSFADYFLTVWDIVRFAKQHGILCQGRGSAANSCVCFIIGITAVDPMVSDVLFERFVSRERGEPPDIDVDFEHERREEVIQYIYSRYGRERAAMVANVICFRRQGALRATGKALGIPLKDIDSLLKGTQDRFEKDRPLLDILNQKIADTGIQIDENLKKKWLEKARLIEGLPRHLGIHSGGFVISQNGLNSLCPTEPATMEGRSVIQWCKDDLEGLGLFKIDVLALGMLTALRKTLKALSAHHIGLPDSSDQLISLESIPADCNKTYDMICAGKTMGTFQIESRAQMSIIPRLQPRNFYDLVIQIGIIRPGPIVAGIVTRYVKRRTKEEPVFFPDERLKPILERTLGVPVFQEQVMRIAMTVGDFTPGEADELRRSMGVWKLNGTIEKFEEKLRAGMRRNGIHETFATEIYRQIEGFSEYGFPESHAISFAHLAYASAWLKAHFPAYFLLGLLNSQPLGFYSLHSLLQEARQAGVRVLKPCLLFSVWDHSIQKQPSSSQAMVRMGLRVVKGLSQQQVHLFCESRRKWMLFFAPPSESCESCESSEPPFSIWSSDRLLEGLESFLHMMDAVLSTKDCFSLILGGLLEAFSTDRRMLLWHFLGRPGHLHADLELKAFSRFETFEKFDTSGVEESNTWEEGYLDLQGDFQITGTSLQNHPLYYIKRWLWPFECTLESITTADKLALTIEKQVVRVCGLVMIKQAPPTAKGMIFVTLEDETGTMNITFTPQIAERYRSILTAPQSGILCLQGLVQGPAFGNSLRVTHVFSQGKQRIQKLTKPSPKPKTATLFSS